MAAFCRKSSPSGPTRSPMKNSKRWPTNITCKQTQVLSMVYVSVLLYLILIEIVRQSTNKDFMWRILYHCRYHSFQKWNKKITAKYTCIKNTNFTCLQCQNAINCSYISSTIIKDSNPEQWNTFVGVILWPGTLTEGVSAIPGRGW